MTAHARGVIAARPGVGAAGSCRGCGPRRLGGAPDHGRHRRARNGQDHVGAPPAEHGDQPCDDRCADEQGERPGGLVEPDRTGPLRVGDSPADVGVAGDGAVRHAEHDQHEPDREREGRAEQRDERRHRDGEQRQRHHRSFAAAVEMLADEERRQPGHLADPEHRGHLAGRRAEGLLEHRQERGNPAQRGVGDRLRGGQSNEVHSDVSGASGGTGGSSGSLRGSEMVIVVPKNEQSVSMMVGLTPSNS